MGLEDLEGQFEKILFSEKDEELKAMVRNMRNQYRLGNIVAAYWILHAFQLGYATKEAKADNLLLKILPIKDTLYAQKKTSAPDA